LRTFPSVVPLVCCPFTTPYSQIKDVVDAAMRNAENANRLQSISEVLQHVPAY
jgi:hypothetical protein